LKRFKIREEPQLIPFSKKIDNRGYFSTPFGHEEISRLNAGETYISLSHTNLAHTVRGMHFQKEPYSEAKLLKVIHGSIFDIVLDLDESRSIDQRIYQFELSENDDVCLYIPRGYAHGYQTQSDNVLLLYALDSKFSKEHASGYTPMSNSFVKLWPYQPLNVKPEDLSWPTLN
jgi:dTDP-4-dehydrorhamnose 3,5-epimerase